MSDQPRRHSPPEFFFGAMSPYSWFSAERIDSLLPDAQWRPVYAGGLFRANDRSSWGLGEARQQGIAECQARAAAYGLGTIRWPEPWPTNDVTVARAMIFAEEAGLLKPFALAAMRLAFLEGGDLGELGPVLRAGERVGIEASRLEAAVAEPAVKEGLRAAHEHAMSLGVFGVPTVVVAGEVFWGDDRLDQAAAAA
ncbi:MAG TPA: DsbA family protein [Solirubrobacteraceae bacterium]